MDPPSSPGMAPNSPASDFTTPRTKVARMLAEIDEASSPSPLRSATSKQNSYSGQALEAGSTTEREVAVLSEPSHPSALVNMDKEGEDVDESDEDVRPSPVRAARWKLQAQTTSVTGSPLAGSPDGESFEETEDNHATSTRIRRKPRFAASAPSSPANSGGNGLFVSPAKSTPEDDDSEEELPSKSMINERRQGTSRQNSVHEAEDSQLREQSRSPSRPSAEVPDDTRDAIEDASQREFERIMSDASRPSRKASKKALLEMERETQRLSRQQALAHQMKVKKKFTTSDLMAKLKMRPIGVNSNRFASSACSAPNSDGAEDVGREAISTPPSSPPTPFDRQKALVEHGALSKIVPVRQDSIASLAEQESPSVMPNVVGVSNPRQRSSTNLMQELKMASKPKKGSKLARLGKNPVNPRDEGSDDELDILPAAPVHMSVFERAIASTRAGMPADCKAIHNLRHLSHLNFQDAGTKKGSRPSIHPRILEAQLRRKAKEQARQQQLERVAELKAKGIEIQTEEQREKEAEEFENLLEKAREQAVALRKAEKAALGKAHGEAYLQPSDDEDEDEEYIGSEDEDDDQEVADEEESGEELIDGAAEERDAEEDGALSEAEEVQEAQICDDAAQSSSEETAAELEEASGPISRGHRSRVRDDKDEKEDGEACLDPIETAVTATPASKSNDPFAAFGFGAANAAALLSPTQAFNATMQAPSQDGLDDSLNLLEYSAPPPVPTWPSIHQQLESQADGNGESEAQAGPGASQSQVPESQRIDLNWETQAPETPSNPGRPGTMASVSVTPGWEPTQDSGLPSPWDAPAPLRRESTLETPGHDAQSTVRVRISESPAPSRAAPKRGKSVRGRAVADDSDEDVASVPARFTEKKRSAFQEMGRKRKEALSAAERADADREMRQMMDEQAEESEDEYAGLGGDDFVAPETEEDRQMIDSSHVEVDERALAAHYAERQRQREEAETSRLYKDLTTGVLRRKMGAAAFDLDEDEDELALRRRQARQREEAKKRKALLKDANIATLAQGKQSQAKDAFLKALADDDSDDAAMIPSDDETDPVAELPPPSTDLPHPLRETTANKRRAPMHDDDAADRPPAKHRRTVAAFKRPTSLLEVQQSLSFLLDDPSPAGAAGTVIAASPSSPASESDDRAEARARQTDAGSASPPRAPAPHRRTAPANPPVVNRLALNRAASASAASALGRTAWAAGPHTDGFKVPSLLRRATTSASGAAGAAGANDRGVTTGTAARDAGSSGGVRMGGGKKSSLAYQARAEERRAIVEAGARRREANTRRVAGLRRRGGSGAGGLGGGGMVGRFE